ncbi:MAG: tetratricopeptide repeat protein [Akkermansia sp.]
MNKFILIIMCVMGSMILSQCSSDAPPKAGTVRLVDPKARGLMAKAQEKEKAGKIGKAIKRYETLVEECPLSLEAPQAQFRIAELHEQLQSPLDAFDAYQKFIERYPNSSRYKQALLKQKDIAYGAATGKLTNKVLWMFEVRMDSSNVIKWLNSVCDNAPFAPSAPESLSILGKYLIERDRVDEAITCYQKLVDNYPTSAFAPLAQLEIADLYRNEQTGGSRNHANIMRAQEAYEDYLQRYTQHSGQAKKGLSDVRRLIIQQKLETGEYYLNRMKDRDAAIFSFEEVIHHAETNPEAATKARAYLKQMGVKR